MKQQFSLNMQVLILAIGSGTAQLIVAAIYILTARSMQPEQYGPVVTAIGLGIAGAGFLDLGTNAYWIRELASERVSLKELESRIWGRLFIVSIIAASISVIAAFLAPTFIATGFTLFTTSAVQMAQVPLKAARRSETIGWLIVAGRMVAVAIFIGQVATGVSSPGTALWTSLSLGDFGLAVLTFAVTPKGYRPGFAIRPIRNPWAGTRWYAISAISVAAQQLDLPIVAAASGPTAAGLYGGVNRWTQPLLVVIGAFTSATAPFIAAESRLANLKAQLLRASWVLFVAIGLSLAVFATAPWVVTLLLGDEFEGSVPVLRLMALAMVLNTITSPLLVAIQSRHLDHLAAVIVATAIAAHLLAVAVLAPSLGALGAGIGVLTGQVVALIGASACIAAVIRRRRSSRR